MQKGTEVSNHLRSVSRLAELTWVLVMVRNLSHHNKELFGGKFLAVLIHDEFLARPSLFHQPLPDGTVREQGPGEGVAELDWVSLLACLGGVGTARGALIQPDSPRVVNVFRASEAERGTTDSAIRASGRHLADVSVQ